MAERSDDRDRAERAGRRRDSWEGAELRRRDALAVIGAAGSGLWLAGRGPRAVRAQGPPCVVTPAQTQGPYFVDERLERADLRADPLEGGRMKEGALFDLELRVLAAGTAACEPLAGAAVDLWHCDAQGVYFDVRDGGFDTRGKQFLRGYQLTDAEGRVRFRTIYPGAYEGRAVHIHFKVRRPLAQDRPLEFTSQLYFEDALNARVHSLPPYPGESRARRMRNGEDFIFRRNGKALVLDVAETSSGYGARFDVALKDV